MKIPENFKIFRKFDNFWLWQKPEEHHKPLTVFARSSIFNVSRGFDGKFEHRWLEACPAMMYLLKVNNRNTKECEICSELTIKIPERRQWRDVVLVILLLNLNIFCNFFCSVSIIDFGQVNADWVKFLKLRERSIKGNPDKKKSEPRHERWSSAFVVNFEHVISHPR